MSHVCGRTSSAKDKASKVFYRKIKPTSKDALTTGKGGADSKCGKCTKVESQHRMKKLRTRKERNQIRNGGKKEAPNNKSCHHYYNHQTSKDISYVRQCCHTTQDALPNIAPVAHELSVITDNRLIGHHGLFNHEVKSINIERLLSEQRKLDRSEKQQGKSNPTFTNPPANETEYVLDSTNDEAVISNKSALQSSKIYNTLKRRVKKTVESNSQGSDLTPGQRSRETLISSTETNKLENVVVTGIKETQPVISDINSDLHQTPCSFKENKKILPGSLPSIIETTPKKLVPSADLSQVKQLTPLLQFSPPMEESSSNLNKQQEDLNTDAVAMSVKAIAASLCNSISFSLLRDKNLLTESREVLVKALRQRHGAQLKSNILKVHRRLYSWDEGQEEVSELSHSPIFADRKESPFSTGEFPTASEATGFLTSSFEKTGRLPFDWNSADWSNPLDQTAGWLGTPADNPVVPNDTFIRRGFPKFSVDFDFGNSVSKEKEHLVSPSFLPSCVDGPRSSGHTDNLFTSSRRKEFSSVFKPTQNDITFSNITGHRRSPLHYSTDPHHSMHSSFETQRKSFPDEIPYFHHENPFDPSRHVNFISASPAFRPVDLAHYPPSYMLEQGPNLSSVSSFASPEHWSFPPMRLY
ncbi:hypothetical protein WMY93_026481 [Mugilogobius chulae]|uniref:Uncharacterized protein n=1 Tax=Mugilogobius chulae TaxID=88201 RepID=A0AAW0N1Y7_9GOBI